MKIFVTGSTGFIGTLLVRRLVKEGYKVTALVRSESAKRSLERLGVRAVIGDINNQEEFLDYLKQTEVVVHLAAIRSNWGDEDDFIRTNSRSIANLFVNNSKIKHVIITSSVYAMGKLAKLPADETVPTCASDLYGRSKKIAEQKTKEYSKKTKIPYTIIRPAIVYGPNDNDLGMIVKMIKLIKSEKFIIIGNGENLLHLIYIDDLIDGVMKIIRGRGKNETYIMAGQKPIKLRDLVSLIQQNLKIKKKIRKIPWVTAYLVALIFETFYNLGYKLLPIFFKNEPFLSKMKVQTLTDNWFYDIGKAKKDLGFNPKVSYDTGIRKVVDWYLNNE